MGSLWTRAVVLAVASTVLISSAASADAPLGALSAALQRTGTAKTAHIALTQVYAASGRSAQSRVSGTLVRGGESRRVSVGRSVYQRRPNTPGTAWEMGARNAPSTDLAFGPLTLADGTSLADPKLYRNAQDLGSEQLPQGQARKIAADLDMAAVGAAMQLSTLDQARLAQMQGRVTLWIATADGTLLRHDLVITIAGAGGARTIDTTIDLTDLDAPLTVTAP